MSPNEIGIAGYDYIGPGRVERRTYDALSGGRAAIWMDYAYDGITGVSNPTGDYGVKQVIETTHTLKDGGGDVVLDEWSYRWDQMYNKTKRTNVRGGRNGPIYTYSYDDAYRLTHSQRQAGMTTSNTYYTLDGTNNRRLVYSVLSYPPPPDNYVLDDTVPPADEQMNQYTQTPFDERTYDANGNLSTWTDGSTIDYEATYDYRNQMISVFDDVTDETTDYRYDALGRRIERDVDGAVTRYYYFGWRVVEEQDGDDDTVATYVYGNYIDEPLQMRRDLGSGMEDFYYHQDDMYNVMALTDESGAVVERYDYKDYGEPIVYDGNGQVISGTAYGNPCLFNGRRYDPETRFYYYRTRYLDPKVGRFTTRDTIGIWGDAANLGNGYAYVGNNPWSWLDAFGLARRRSGFRIDVRDHGGVHLQCGNDRFRGQDLSPIEHNGRTPDALTPSELQELVEDGTLDKLDETLTKEGVENEWKDAVMAILAAEFGEEVAREAAEQGVKKLSRKAQKAIAKKLLKALGPVAVIYFFVEDAEARGITYATVNIAIPSDIVQDLIDEGADWYSDALDQGQYNVFFSRCKKLGWSDEECHEMAMENTRVGDKCCESSKDQGGAGKSTSSDD